MRAVRPIDSSDAPPNQRSQLPGVGRWLCLAAAGFGVVGLLDGLLGAGIWTSVLLDASPMPTNSALGLVMLGGAGALRYRPDVDRARTTISALAALVALLIGVVTLAEYAFGLDFPISHLLDRGEPPVHPVRPAPLAAIALSLLGLAVLTLDARLTARVRPSEWFTLIAWLVGFTTVVGFLFGAEVLYHLGRAPMIGVAPPTALGLVLISAGLLLALPTAGLMRVATAPGSGGILLRRLTPATIVGPALLGVAAMHVLRALGIESSGVLGAVLAASMTVVGLLLLVITAAPLNRAHEALDSGRARIEYLVEQAPDGIFVADLEGRYTDVNRVGCRMLGFTRDQIVGKRIVDLIPDDLVPRLEQEKRQLLDGEEQVGEWLLRKSDGTWLPVEVSAKILPDGRWQGFVRDISGRKQREQELRHLQEEQQRAIQVRDSVLGIVAHDLRNPLGTILMQAAVLRRPGAEPERRSKRPAETIERSGNRMNRIIQDLLDVTLMEEGRLAVEQNRVSAYQIISDAVEAHGPLATAASLELELDAERYLPEVWADRDRLLQIFDNLIGNALKFTEAGGIVTVGAVAKPGEVLFWVADTGAGITPESLPHIFDRFWQASRGQRRGVGLGLPIAKGIVEAHGGRIWVESTFGRGSTFFFTIPTVARAQAWAPGSAPHVH